MLFVKYSKLFHFQENQSVLVQPNNQEFIKFYKKTLAKIEESLNNNNQTLSQKTLSQTLGLYYCFKSDIYNICEEDRTLASVSGPIFQEYNNMYEKIKEIDKKIQNLSQISDAEKNYIVKDFLPHESLLLVDGSSKSMQLEEPKNNKNYRNDLYDNIRQSSQKIAQHADYEKNMNKQLQQLGQQLQQSNLQIPQDSYQQSMIVTSKQQQHDKSI